MTWMTWRQHRGAAAVGATVLLAITTGLTFLGISVRSNVRRFGLSACLQTGSDCSTAIAHLYRQYHWLPPAAASLIVLPVLAGMFWGAPLIAREIETGTHRVVWAQSVSRLRWISTKLILILGVTATATLGISLLAVWSFQPLIPVLGNQFQGNWFDVQGIVPVAYIVFALALGACIGAIWRRTIPAMATTMIVYAALRIPMHNIRQHLLTPNVKIISTFIGDKPIGLGAGDWILSQTPTGLPTSGPPTNGPPATIFHYIPAGRFWTLQALEAGIFLLAATVLVAVCISFVVRSPQSRRQKQLQLAGVQLNRVA
jgi:hypothetical protein